MLSKQSRSNPELYKILFGKPWIEVRDFVVSSLVKKSGRWAMLPNWVFWPALKEIVFEFHLSGSIPQDSFDRAWTKARLRMMNEPKEESENKVILGPSLLWGAPPAPKVKIPEWVPGRKTRGEFKAKPGESAMVFTFDGPRAAGHALRTLRKDLILELPCSEWEGETRTFEKHSCLWLKFERRRATVQVQVDRRKTPR